MLKGKLILVCCLLATISMFAQDADIIIVDDELRPYCIPGCEGKSKAKGILLQYDINPTYNLSSSSENPLFSGENNFVNTHSRLTFKAKAPFLNKESIKVIFGIKYSQENFVIEHTPSSVYNLHESLDRISLKSFGTSLYIMKPFRGKTYLITRLGVEFNGDYQKFVGFNPDYASYSVASILGIKKNPNLDIGFGLGYRYKYGRHSVIPLINYYHTFSPKWGIEATLPVKAALRHNFSDNTILLAKVSGHSGNYFLKEASTGSSFPAELAYSRTELQMGFELQQKLYSLVWLGLAAGYRRDLNFSFNDPLVNPRSSVISSAANDGLFFSISLFVTPPKK
ncbi:MAG: DUF6268 family outer membrane beta-barrel protein [Bacteroidota bacterium]